MNISLQNVEVFASIVYIARFGVVNILAKKVSFLNDFPDVELRSEITNV
jgi:hypothetical protein